MTYGLSDIASPFIQFKGTLAACYRESIGMGLCAIYRRDNDGWKRIASRYWDTMVHERKIVNQ